VVDDPMLCMNVSNSAQGLVFFNSYARSETRIELVKGEKSLRQIAIERGVVNLMTVQDRGQYSLNAFDPENTKLRLFSYQLDLDSAPIRMLDVYSDRIVDRNARDLFEPSFIDGGVTFPPRSTLSSTVPAR
jgi:hypothetical protein